MWSFCMRIHTDDLALVSYWKDCCRVCTELDSGKTSGGRKAHHMTATRPSADGHAASWRPPVHGFGELCATDSSQCTLQRQWEKVAAFRCVMSAPRTFEGVHVKSVKRKLSSAEWWVYPPGTPHSNLEQNIGLYVMWHGEESLWFKQKFIRDEIKIQKIIMCSSTSYSL